ncbi:MAG: hypothetical protein N2712_02635 [Brevinematales bacterium]|nr:hypothetical protein [Brevinematales bacterium]
MKGKIFGISLFGFLLFNFGYAVDFSKPDDVVSNAIEMLIKKDFSSMVHLTELSEKKRVEKIIDVYLTDKSLVDREIGNIQSYQFSDVYYENDIAVVRVNWVVKNSYQTKEGIRVYNANRKVIYLLKKFDDKWKIITKRVEI